MSDYNWSLLEFVIPPSSGATAKV